jgi:hypothetical protein
MVRRMKAEKKIGSPISQRSGYAISTKNEGGERDD